jgi:hypothetical protein
LASPSGDGDVDPGALGGKGGEIGGDHDGGNVGGAQAFAARVDAHALKHGLQALSGERRVVEAVAGAVKAHDEPVAHKLVVADAFDIDNILDARRRGVSRGHRGGEGGGGHERCHRQSECGLEHCLHPVSVSGRLFPKSGGRGSGVMLRNPCQVAYGMVMMLFSLI